MNRSTSASARWRRVLAGHGASGLSVAAFCRRAGVPASSFFYWRRKLRSRGASPDQAAAFAEVRVTPEAAALSSGIELRLPGRRRIVVRPGFDRRTLLDLLSVLEAGAEAASRETRP